MAEGAPQPGPGPSFRVLQPGRMPYRRALELQATLVEERRHGSGDILVLLEHDPVITLGRGARPDHLLLSEAELAERGIEVATAARGGDVTWHGPGQLVGYPIVDLTPRGRDLHRYLRSLEEVLLRTLAAFGVAGRRSPGRTGVWIGDAKIASIGIGVRRWVAWHGFALNLAADLPGFAAIVPCGLQGVRITSLEEQLGAPAPRQMVVDRLVEAFATVFQSRHEGSHDSTLPP